MMPFYRIEGYHSIQLGNIMLLKLKDIILFKLRDVILSNSINLSELTKLK